MNSNHTFDAPYVGIQESEVLYVITCKICGKVRVEYQILNDGCLTFSKVECINHFREYHQKSKKAKKKPKDKGIKKDDTDDEYIELKRRKI